MKLPVNTFKQGLRAGRPQIGLWSALCSNISAEVIAGSGFDWILLDTEHAPNEVSTVLCQLHAMSESPAAPIVRPAWNDPVLLKRFLDIGVQSFLMPFIQDAGEAQYAVAATRYPPRGMRGVATGPRANRYGRIKDYFQKAEEQICILVQVETRKTLEHIEAIAAVDGVDGLFIGPSDLAANLGHLGNSGHPEVRAAIEDAIQRIIKAGKAPGILAPDETEARQWLDRGCLAVAVGSDIGLLARQSEALAARFKQRL